MGVSFNILKARKLRRHDDALKWVNPAADVQYPRIWLLQNVAKRPSPPEPVGTDHRRRGAKDLSKLPERAAFSRRRSEPKSMRTA